MGRVGKEWNDCRKKTRFRTEGDALEALSRIKRNPREKFPVRAYQCEFCNGGWHLSSKRERNEGDE